MVYYTRYIIPDIRLCQSCKIDISGKIGISGEIDISGKVDISGKIDISGDIPLSFFIVCNLIELASTSTMRIYL